MVFRDPLDTQLREIAWTQASRRWEPPGSVVPADPRDYDASDEERLAGCLGLLHSYTHMVKILQRRIDLTVDAALAHGASYGQIAAVCGVSRQAVRQRRLRHDQQTQPRRVQPTATPSDQQTGTGHAGRTAPSTHQALQAPNEAATPRERRPRRAGAKFRVYELAKEFGVESKVILARLNGMGEFVRSASSTVEPSLIRRLRDEFASSARRDLRDDCRD
jgi:hypothetical protein